MDIIEEEVKTKRCSKCGRILPLSEFSKCKSSKDGRFSYCKDCKKEFAKAYYAKHRGEIKAYDAEYRANNKEKIKAYYAEYYQAHKDKIKAYKAEWRAKNKVAIAQKATEWYKANKEKIKAYNAEWYQTHRDSELKKRAEYCDPQKNPLGWARKIVGHYRDMDRERGFDTSKTVTAEWFVQNIMYKPCAHCGLLKVGAIGANRLNNDLGHEASNLEPCCMPCNSREGVRYQIERGLHISQIRKKQSFKEFVKEHKAKDKNLT